MAKDIQIPDYIKEMQKDGSSSADLISATSSVPRISLKGMKFRFIRNGEVVKKTSEPIKVVIIGAQPEKGMAKTFYKGKYNPDSSDPPDCSSSTGVKPDPWIDHPEHHECATCPNNAWGSAKSMSGKKAKACRDSKRLIVVNPKHLDDPEEYYVLNVTVSSLKNLSNYGKFLAEHQLPKEVVITEISMDEDSDYPVLEFKFLGALKKDLGMKALTIADEKPWDSISSTPLIEHDSDDDDDEDKPEEPKKEKKDKKKKKKDKKKKKGKKEKVVKGELVDESSSSDVDDLLGNW